MAFIKCLYRLKNTLPAYCHYVPKFHCEAGPIGFFRNKYTALCKET